MNPVKVLQEDRDLARVREDPCVDRCVLGTIDSQGEVQQRVLVLRDIDGQLALFYSATSAKHRELTERGFKASLLTFFPTIGVQYRMSIQLHPIESNIVRDSWQFKPNAAKRMDALYRRFPQGTVVSDIEEFETLYAASVPPRQAPQHSVGYFVRPELIERLVLKTDPAMHVRERYLRQNDSWVNLRLVP